MTVQCTYELHGVCVSTDVELRAPLTHQTPEFTTSIVGTREVRHDAGPGELLAAFRIGEASQWLTRSENRLAMGFGGACEFTWIEGERSLQTFVDPRSDPRHVPLLLEGAGLARLVALSGGALLHASAVQVDGKIIAVVGPSGAGKSTIAAWICGATDACLVTDDTLRVQLDEQAVCGLRGTLSIRLRRGAEFLSDRFDGSDVGVDVDGRVTVRPAAMGENTAPLGAIVVPEISRTAHRVRVRRLSSLNATVELLRVPRSLGWLIDEPLRAHLAAATELAERVPVLRSEIPWGTRFDPTLAIALVAAVCEHVQ